MARTRQTARRSTGGLAPRRQFATMSSNNGFGDQQVQVWTETGTRTIVVEGTAELNHIPDIVHLSFLVSETADSIPEGIQTVLSKLSQVRKIAMDCGVPNSNVSSDSIGSTGKKTEYGYYEKDNSFKVTETKTQYEVKSVVRICLDGSDGSKASSKLFSKLCFEILGSLGLRTYEAPMYDSSELTSLRHQARVDACENAKEKATKILGALNDPNVKIGRPVCIRDVHCDIDDDSHNSFDGNWTSWQTEREIVDNQSASSPTKKARIEKSKEIENPLSSLDSSIAEHIFAVPPIKIAACVQAIFEIADTG